MAQTALSEKYDYGIVKMFTVVAVIYGVVGFLVGDLAAWELAFPNINGGIPYISFGRIRPLHTSAVIFAFGGSVLFATSYYIVQRTCKARLFAPGLARFTFWGWNAVIVGAVITYPLGMTQGQEYAETIWPIDILITLVWVAYFIIFVGTLARRQEKHIYVANWFLLAFIITVAVLHLGNNIHVPVSLTESYPLFSGVQNAMIQWWYGHNAVGFFLTAAFLGMMYYFVPKQAERPVFSYRLSIVHFWALVFLYIWAGPHHLHYTALPDWTGTLGMTFSIMLILPSWGGMINGIMTLSGAWEKLRTDPIIRFMVISLSFYGMSTFEGPIMSIKDVNALSHYTDWTVGHVHSGALGWVAMISFGCLYHMVPRLWNTTIYSVGLITFHFWLATIGVVLYIASMWVSGIMQGLMWRWYDSYGNLAYDFATTVQEMHLYYVIRATGGALFVVGGVVMAYNVFMTIKKAGQETTVGATAAA
ncbi:cytochrome-c oxidase, cbb3-type subunit I [Magnetofaba australis]|uniref:cytochrome-c oxidase n=1 Tax=Magnetofaba australis IT-1 TaxID=1434232 RepID=A0A1Y2K4G6_9PROT|nr:cytochrome-c oxidase, cbb3-type subunit I [Magnetofaba australis]OSM02557.1 putative cbb3-type cytochrome C oxidase subunit I [Magnetofaba australis IT-1]